jgi:hypothetical protein
MTGTIIAVPNRQTFEIEYPDGVTTLPTLSASTFLVEDRSAGILGIYEIATVPDVNTFTIDITDVPAFPTGPIEGLSIATRTRIYAAANIDRAVDIYTKYESNNLVLFLIMNDVDVSKDRHTLTDAIAGFTRVNFGKQTFLQNFSTVVFFPTNDGDKAGGNAQQQAYGEVFLALYSTLYGVAIEDPDTKIPYVIVSNGHGVGQYTNSYYTHVYEWQIPSVLTFDDGFNQQPSVAFRDINSAWDLLNDSESQLLLDVNLDDEPL